MINTLVYNDYTYHYDSISAVMKSPILSPDQKWIACHACDALWERPELAVGERARCGRCGEIILQNKPKSLDRSLALLIAALILYLVAVSFPFMSMSWAPLKNQISVIDAIVALWDSRMYLLAVIAFCLILLLPLARILLLLWIVSTLRWRPVTTRFHARVFRYAQLIEPWAMVEIFMVGIIISLVKVGDLAKVGLGPAFWALAALVIILAYFSTVFCKDTIWQQLKTRL